MKKTIFLGLVLLVFVIGGLSMAQDQEMMKKWQAFMTPGKYHQQLATYTGEWSFKGKAWMEPESPPMEMKGIVTGKMILGGRYLKMYYKGMSMGQPFEGLGITAYDNHLKVFHSTWIDNMGTGIFISKGKAGDGKVREEVGAVDDPMGSGKVQMRNVFTVLSKDKFKMEMFSTSKKMPEFKNMEIIFTRKVYKLKH